METTFINLTPHAINFCNSDGEIIEVIPTSGIIARCKPIMELKMVINGKNVYETVFGEVESLPEFSEGTYYIVSQIVSSAVKGYRNDCLFPNEIVRDEKGNIIGCKSLGI